MLNARIGGVVAGLLLLVSGFVSAAENNTLSDKERKAGWKLLFDGKTTDGWKGYKKDKVPDAWKVVDGVLTLDGKGGDICTVEEFCDFELQADWKISVGGNSGIMYRVSETRGAPY